MKLECSEIQIANILLFSKLLKVLFKNQQLVVLASVVGKNRNAILELVQIWKGGVVNKNCFWKVSVYNAQVFTINFVADFHAMVSVKSVINQLIFWIYLVEDHISITLLAGRKNNDFEVFLGFLEKT